MLTHRPTPAAASPTPFDVTVESNGYAYRGVISLYGQRRGYCCPVPHGLPEFARSCAVETATLAEAMRRPA